jgi:ribosome assembly protein 1
VLESVELVVQEAEEGAEGIEGAEDVGVGDAEAKADGAAYGPLSGQLISAARSGCHKAFSNCSQFVRIAEAMYKCDLQCHCDQIGNLYGVIAKRRGKVLEEELLEGTPTFCVVAAVPFVESFGLAQELLKKTAGEATSPQVHALDGSTSIQIMR